MGKEKELNLPLQLRHLVLFLFSIEFKRLLKKDLIFLLLFGNSTEFIYSHNACCHKAYN